VTAAPTTAGGRRILGIRPAHQKESPGKGGKRRLLYRRGCVWLVQRHVIRAPALPSVLPKAMTSTDCKPEPRMKDIVISSHKDEDSRKGGTRDNPAAGVCLANAKSPDVLFVVSDHAIGP